MPDTVKVAVLVMALSSRGVRSGSDETGDGVGGLLLASASGPPACAASSTQWAMCSSSRPSATAWSALVTAETWVRMSMQYLSSSTIRAIPRTWPSMRRIRLA